MTRRKMILRFMKGAFGLLLAGPALMWQVACKSRPQLVKWANTVIGVLHDISPILTDMGAPQIVALVTQAAGIAEKLRKAFEENDDASAAKFLQSLTDPKTGVIVQIAESIGVLGNDARKRIIQGSLALAQVTLRLIGAQIESDVAAVAAVATADGKALASMRALAAEDKLRLAFETTRF